TSLIRRTRGCQFRTRESVEHDICSCDLTGLNCAEGSVDARQRTALTHRFRPDANGPSVELRNSEHPRGIDSSPCARSVFDTRARSPSAEKSIRPPGGSTPAAVAAP